MRADDRQNLEEVRSYFRARLGCFGVRAERREDILQDAFVDALGVLGRAGFDAATAELAAGSGPAMLRGPGSRALLLALHRARARAAKGDRRRPIPYGDAIRPRAREDGEDPGPAADRAKARVAALIAAAALSEAEAAAVLGPARSSAYAPARAAALIKLRRAAGVDPRPYFAAGRRRRYAWVWQQAAGA